jgi:hypothetical protein
VSYDLHLFKADEGDPGELYERLEEDEEEREPTPEEEAELRSLAADLQAASPGLDLVEPTRGFLLQLGYESERPVVIDIGAGTITMSWSYGADRAREAIGEVRTYLPVFERHGYVAYDPQLEKIFDPDRDAAEAEETHAYVRGELEEVYGRLTGGQKPKPWWKRLFR